MKHRLKGRLYRKLAEYDAKDNCRICSKPILKGQEIEILVEASNDKAAVHAGQCADDYLAWRNAFAECEDDLGRPVRTDDEVGQLRDCALRKLEE